MSILAPPEPKLEYVRIGDLRAARVTVILSKWHAPVSLYLIDAGMRFHVADNHMGKDAMFKHKSFARAVEYAEKKLRALVRIEWAAFQSKKTLNG